MTWQLLPARENFPAFAADWDRLNAELYDRHPFFDSRFIGPLLDHFGNGKELLCIHRAANTIDGALILRPLGLGRWALFLPSQSQAGAMMLPEIQWLESLYSILPGYAWSLDLLAIDPDYAPRWDSLRLPSVFTPHALTIAVAIEGDFAAYWKTRPKNLIKNVRRYQRRAEESAGPLTVTATTEPAEIISALARYGQLESAGWKGREGTAIRADNAQGRFYADTLERFAASGQALVMELRAGEQLVASRLFIRHERMWIILKTTYDETQSAYAPGRLLLHAVLERAFADLPGGSVEFYTNANRDQTEWATRLRYIHHHQIFRNRIMANLRALIHVLKWHRASSVGDNSYDPVRVIGYRQAEDLPEEATSLFEDATPAGIEATTGWFANLQRTVFPDDPGVRYYVKSFDETATAALPLRLTRRGLLRQIESLGNYYTSLYQPIHSNPGKVPDLTSLLRAAQRDHGGAHVMRFAPLDPEAPTYTALLTALRNLGWVPFRFFCFGNWYLKVSGNFDSYLKSRNGSMRSTIKRMGRKFTTDGGTFELIATPAQVAQGIDDFTHVYCRSWKQPEPYPEFVPGLMRWLAATGQLRLGIARLAGQPIAAQLWIVHQDKASIFKVAYDENFSDYSPGTILSSLLMEHVINHDKVAEVDFLIGDDKYKQNWMSHRRERWGIVAYNPRTLIGLLLLIREGIGRGTRRLRLAWQSRAKA